MSDLRVGALVRIARRRLGLRQKDVGLAAAVSQQTVSLIELGQFADLGLDTIRAVVGAVGVDLPFAPRWRGAEGDRLLDARHAEIVEGVVRELRVLDWEIVVEYSFSHFGERGSVDIIAWRPASRTLLLVEVKTELVDVQMTLRALSIKERVVPPLVAREKGWKARHLAIVIVLPDERGRRASITRHASIFDAALPARTREVRKWLREPVAPLRGIWFLHLTKAAGDKQRPGGPTRIRRPKGAGDPDDARSGDDRSRPEPRRDEGRDRETPT